MVLAPVELGDGCCGSEFAAGCHSGKHSVAEGSHDFDAYQAVGQPLPDQWVAG